MENFGNRKMSVSKISLTKLPTKPKNRRYGGIIKTGLSKKGKGKVKVAFET